MHCPHCGTQASPDRRFCRACGFNLTQISKKYVEELETKPEGSSSEGRGRRNRLGMGLMFGGIATIFIAAYWAIISEIIIGKGQVVGGIVFLLVLTAIVSGGILLASGERRSSQRAASNKQSEPLLFPEQQSAIAPSVTEHTTELIGREDEADINSVTPPPRKREVQ